jgi:cephalosporin hydroxylase
MQNDFGVELNALADRYYGAGEPEKKPPIYFAEYDRLFSQIRAKPIRLLELGVRSGASMLVWRDYFPTATIVGLDIDECPPIFPKEERFHFIQGSQDDHSALDDAVRVAGGPFDIIIDDASHVGHITARSFAHLFPRGLKDGVLRHRGYLHSILDRRVF